ncbi:MAG: ABC transporter ATP-binding protein [Candidatus Izemoplasmatales bacterium]|nr:ABC transporter ATP-binding protein [Candidatus Izemoplasmatales bacterium]
MEKNNEKDTIKRRPQGGFGGGGPFGGRGIVEKPKDFKTSMKNLFRYVKPFHLLMGIALAAAIGGTIFNIVGPKLLGNITNEVQISIFGSIPINLTKIASIGFLLIVLYVLSYIFTLAQGFIMNEVTQRISKKLRTDITSKINRLPLKYFDSRSYGDILSIVTNDVDSIGQTLNQSLVSLITSVTTVIGVIIMMLTISWVMTILVVAILPLSMLLMGLIMKSSQKYFRVYQNGLGLINGHIEEIYSGHNIIKVFNANTKAKVAFDQMNNRLYEGTWKSQFFSGLMMPVMSFVGNFSYVAVSVVGGILAVAGKVMIGGIQSMLQYVGRVSQPLMQIAQAFNQLQSTAAAAERVFAFLEAEEMSNEFAIEKHVDQVKGAVEFSHVHFGYSEDKTIINDFSMKTTAGQKIAIVGPTGAGKTTIVNLLMRFYELNSGDILIDDISTKSINRNNVHSLFGMVLQDSWLFKGTIRENLAYANQDATMEEIKSACQLANIDHFIESLPGGYDMMLSEDSSISEGQKQLFTIARAMIANPPMLILDEATSSVDTRTEILIQEAMDILMKGKTTFVIAHRLSTIKNADLILVMKDGDIIETGNHQDLINQNGFYASLYNSQFETVAI